jgi:hypothetical protein
MCQGVTRDQVIKHLKMDFEKATWDLFSKGVTHWFYKVGDQAGVMALLNCENMEEARALVNETPAVKNGLIEFDIEPVDHFPNFG